MNERLILAISPCVISLYQPDASARASLTDARVGADDYFLPLKAPWQPLQSIVLRSAGSPVLTSSTTFLVRSFHSFSSPFGFLDAASAVYKSIKAFFSSLLALPSMTF